MNIALLLIRLTTKSFLLSINRFVILTLKSQSMNLNCAKSQVQYNFRDIKPLKISNTRQNIIDESKTQILIKIS